VDGYVVDQPRIDDHVAVRPPLHALPAQSRPGRDPLTLVVADRHQCLDPLVVDESGSHVTPYDVDGGLPATLGQHRGPVDPGDPVGHGRDLRVGLVGHKVTLTSPSTAGAVGQPRSRTTGSSRKSYLLRPSTTPWPYAAKVHRLMTR
jgi:hypothetical protein